MITNQKEMVTDSGRGAGVIIQECVIYCTGETNRHVAERERNKEKKKGKKIGQKITDNGESTKTIISWHQVKDLGAKKSKLLNQC